MKLKENQLSRRTFITRIGQGTGLLLTPNLFVRCINNETANPKGTNIPSKGAHVVSIDGTPELFVDGVKMSRMWGRLALPSDYAPEKMEQYAPAGIDVYMTACDTAISLCWNGEDEFYFDKYEAHIRRLVEIKPDIKLILYVGGTGGVPYRWCMNHPGELTLFSTGYKLETASLASEIWLKDSSRAFSEFVKYFCNGKYAHNIIGFNPVYNANEWFSHHRKADNYMGWPDFSKPMLAKFRNWLTEKYRNDVNALRDSWNDDNVSFETAEIPTIDQRLYPESETLFHNCTPLGNRISDYYQCYDELVARLGIQWCKTIKEASNHIKLAGMMHGYSYCGRFDAGIYPQHHGHGAALEVISSEYVDFLHSPYHYYNRSVDGTHYSQHAADTVINHGKLMIDQIDSKPYLRWGPNHNASNPWESLQLLKRDVMYSISKNCYCYWLEGGPGNMFPIVRFSPERFGPLWFDAPELKEMIAKLKKLTDKNQNQKTTDVSEVAIFTSNAGTFFQKMQSRYGAMYVEIFRQWIMPHTGVPFDDYILEDIPNIKKKYKVCIFLDAHYIPSSLREQIVSWLDKNQTTALWFYAPGYLDERGCNPSNMKDLTGIDLAVAEQTSHLQTLITNTRHPLVDKMKEKEYGTDIDPQIFKKDIRWMPWPYKNEDFKMNPLVYSNDLKAEVIGKLKNGNKDSLVAKKLNGRLSVYSSSPMMPSALVRNILKESGVHIYTNSGDLIYANSGYVSISSIAGKDEEKEILFPRAVTVRDALTGELIAENTNRLKTFMKYKETKIYKTG